jgi:hypothetical protein
MQAGAMRGFIREMPHQGWLCHRVTLSLYRFAMTGKPRIVTEPEALDFAVRLGDRINEARKVQLPVLNEIPPQLYSVFALKDKWCTALAGWQVISHTAILIEEAPAPFIAQGQMFKRGIEIVPLDTFIFNEHRKGAEIFEFSPEVLKRHF